MKYYERNITTRIGSIARAEYEKGRGADRNPKEENTGGSHLSCTVVKPDFCLARIFFSKIWFPFSYII